MKNKAPRPIMLGTWSFGLPAVDAAWPSLIGPEGSAVAAVEAACAQAESDLSNQIVGVGNLPDRDGDISLGAAIMASPSRRGGVCNIRSYAHPISVARRVMEKTPQPVSRASRADVWHDAIGVLALDANSEVVAGCSTSGSPRKVAGRAGEWPIIGHGIYADPSIGACVCIGDGELIGGICGAFLAVEHLRRGHSPRFAAMEVIRRIEESCTLSTQDQVGVIVLSDDGTFASASLQAGFRIAVRDDLGGRLADPDFVLASQQQILNYNGFVPAAPCQEENFQLEMQ